MNPFFPLFGSVAERIELRRPTEGATARECLYESIDRFGS